MVEEGRETHEHENCSIFGRPTPILCWMGAVACPIRLSNRCGFVRIHLKVDTISLTLIPQRKGEMLLPTTLSWFMARISLFVSILRMSGVIADSCVYITHEVAERNTTRLTLVPICNNLISNKIFREPLHALVEESASKPRL
jgi:hypothetical protein